ncbi:MAG: 5'-3' exonuclease H3TH domain-containing protein [Pseudomonadota bacterium]
MELIFLVDASVYVFRAYYSMPPDMRDGDGNPVHALYGFARFLGDLLERAQPEYIAVAFDASLSSSFRNRIYPPYKANREPAPPDLMLQFERCRNFCERLGIAWFDSTEFEADDIIGTLAVRMRGEGLRTTIVTRDKDMAQLIGPGDVYWDYSGDERYHHGEIAGRFGVAPERYADYLALTGDAVDNIAGVPGIGPKTATALLQVYESLEDLYARLDTVRDLPLRGASRLPEKLAMHRDKAFLARELTRIRCDMPLAVTRADLRRKPPDLAGIEGFCSANNFGLLLQRQAARLTS